MKQYVQLTGNGVIGVRADDASATVRLSRDHIEIDNGIADDVSVVIDGGLELLLDVATRALGRELSSLSPRR